MNTALVTGANKGIGYEVARQLAGKGFQVFVGARNRDAGQKAVAKIAEEGGKAIFLEIDVADNPSVTVAAREFAKAADHLDVLVNNAGIILMATMQFWRSATSYCERRWRQIRWARCV
ncbi:MAG: short chain dehydrogenase [Candidatus Udaeobacter sp.]|jgi:NAD(P)-dependent dehydrogenase (short-subunit alcohol dehydrogenase family)|nr:MAG: short chain dehydrogenase [Candidatus Udaeobacter sp.]